MYSLYLCVHCFSVYRYIYSCVCSFFVRLQHWGAARFCSFATFAAVFIIAAVSITFAASCVGFWLFAPPYLYRRFCVPFAVPFALKRLQRSFYSVFRAVLSDPNFRRVLLYLLHRSSLSHGSKHGKNAVIRGRGAPWGAGRAARLTLRTIFYFLFPKIFFLENSLSPSASCLPFQCQNPSFMVPFLVCVPTRPRRSPN